LVLHHVALPIPKALLGACRDFYATLGFAEIAPPEGIVGRAAWLEREGTQVHLAFGEDPADARPSAGHLAVVAPDYETTVGALRAAGHEVEPRAEHWGSPRAFVRDPAGHRVEVMAFPPGAGRPV
jgi:catechol 2,3-dioxygenase-like lactoylglutathione lyase family enzyme